MAAPTYHSGLRCVTCGVAAFATNEHGLSGYVRDAFAELHAGCETETIEPASTETAA